MGLGDVYLKFVVVGDLVLLAGLLDASVGVEVGASVGVGSAMLSGRVLLVLFALSLLLFLLPELELLGQAVGGKLLPLARLLVHEGWGGWRVEAAAESTPGHLLHEIGVTA